MKKIGTLNTRLSRLIAGMGHMDRLVICDCGLPIPNGKTVVDLALTKNIPRFIDTLRVVLEELQVEEYVVAEEMEARSAHVLEDVKALLPDVSGKAVPHEEFKRMLCENQNTAFVRTGEATPYANVMLISGVTF